MRAWLEHSEFAFFGRFALQIVKNCDAMDLQILLLSAIVALPVRWGLRLLGGVAGFLLVSLANVTRIASLYFIGVHAPAEFELAHREWWPLLLVLWALGAFLIFVRVTREAVAAGSLRKLP
jgi:exosortase/archaeosortase family protein